MKFISRNVVFAPVVCVLAICFSSLWIVNSYAASPNDDSRSRVENAEACNSSTQVELTLRCYLPTLLSIAYELNIDPALVLAIMHQESGFNPQARSHANALGLMQIKPETSAKDITKRYIGTAIELPESFVLTANNNIALGVHYLHLLKQQYLKDINIDYSQKLAMIAAYNGGIGTLTRWYKNGSQSFTGHINSVSSDEFKQTLIENHPYKETRDYVKKVSNHYAFYKKLLTKHSFQKTNIKIEE